MARLKKVLETRQPDLTVLLDGVRTGRNLSAIVRTCDAVGVLRVHGIPAEGRRPRLRREASSGSRKWVQVRWHADREAALRDLRERGLRIVAADPGPGAADFREVDYTLPRALVLGAEVEGISALAAERADARIRVPMHGMVESLNVSVAAALVLYEAERQRRAAGMYAEPRLPPERVARLLFEWGHPRLAGRLRERGLPFPAVRDDGSLDFGRG
jgi:tRNA (guanosine-2'-O-)-methyltransferase